jgi:hypothetical protein
MTGAALLLLALKLNSDAAKLVVPPFDDPKPPAGIILAPEIERRQKRAAGLRRNALAVGALGAFLLIR